MVLPQRFLALTTLLSAARATSNCDVSRLTEPSLYGASILSISATQVNNSTLSNPPTSFCNVSITYTHPGQNDKINVLVWLPSPWNGRFGGFGGGGWSTGPDPANMVVGVARGLAVASTDGGHPIGATDASWAELSPGNINWYELQNFAAVSLNDMTVIGKQITESFYEKTINKSYWYGCSTGGRQGLMMAQRYPDAYDGIVAEAPAINWADFVPAGLWPQWVMKETGYFPSNCELDAITAAAVEACDELDGLKDGVIGNEEACDFDPRSAVGKSYACGIVSGTISAKAATIVQSIWNGPRDSNGKFQWYGMTYQAPLTAIANTTCATNATCKGVPFSIALDWYRTFLARNASFDPSSMTHADLDALMHLSKNQYTSVLGTSDPDLSLFRKSGGKMITWHGMADQVIFFNGTVDYYERVLALDPNARDFFRFYSAPGVFHCRGGTGAEPTDDLAALVKWVEDGIAPETLPANRTVNGERWEQNLCQYPLMSVYKGGDAKDASSFQCE